MAPTIGEISKLLGIPEKTALLQAKKEGWSSTLVGGEPDYKTILLPKGVRKKIEAALKAEQKKKPVQVAEPEPDPVPAKKPAITPPEEYPNHQNELPLMQTPSDDRAEQEPAEPEVPAVEPAAAVEPEQKPSPEPVPVPELKTNLPATIEQARQVEIVRPKQIQTYEIPTREIINLPEDVKEIGLLRYNLVKKWREHVATAEWGKGMEASQSFCLAYNGGHLLPGIYARIGNIAESTLRAMDKKLRQNADDYVCLCDGRAVKSIYITCERSLSEDEKKAFLNCYLDPRRPSVRLAFKAARLLLKRKGVDVTASEKTFRRFLDDFGTANEGIICLAREGEKAWKDRYGSYITRDLSLLKPCQCLVADGKTLNFQILHPNTGKPCRMTLILFEDMRTRCPVGWQIMPTEDTIAIHAAFRNAVMNIGRYPEVVYLDNGRAFKAKYFKETNPDFGEFRGLYARVGTAVLHANPYNGRAKIVERFFKLFQERCECLMPSYCGDSIATKPAWMNRNEKFHKELHKARTNNWIPGIREASAVIASYLECYAKEPTDLLGGRSPLEVLSEGIGPGIPIEQLNWDFMWRKAITPRNGRLRHWNIDYEADFLINLSRSKPVMCLFDTSDIRIMYCYTMEGHYLGEAKPVRALHPLATLYGDALSARQVKDINAKHNRQLKNAKEQLLEIGAGKDMVDGLDALPFNQQVAIIVSSANAADKAEIKLLEEKLPEAEVIRLENYMEEQIIKAEIEEREPCTIPRPEFWRSDLEHYEWAFAVMYEHGQQLSEEDEAFMQYFELTEEFKNNYQGRFEDLKLLYGT